MTEWKIKSDLMSDAGNILLLLPVDYDISPIEIVKFITFCHQWPSKGNWWEC
jgi:hypothetical protein